MTEDRGVVGIDFDNTFSDHPSCWLEVVDVLRRHGYRVVCVTCRRDTEENREDVQTPGIPRFFTGGRSKKGHMLANGVRVKIWIEDDPRTIIEGI